MRLTCTLLLWMAASAACQTLPPIEAPTHLVFASYGRVTGLTGTITLSCNGNTQSISHDGNFTCNPNNGAPSVTIVEPPAGETCTVSQTAGDASTWQVVVDCIAQSPVGTVSTPTPTPTANSTLSVNVIITGVLLGSTVSVSVNGNTRSGLGNNSYTFASGKTGDTFAASVVSAGPGLSCTLSPMTGTLTSSGASVTVHCARALRLTQNQAAALVIGQSDFTTGTAGPVTSGLNLPRGVAMSAQLNRLYIGDTNNSRVATLLAPQGNGAALSALADTGNYQGPRRIWINDAGAMAVADLGTHKVMLCLTSPNTSALPDVILGSGFAGIGPQVFNGPTAAFLLDHNMLIADRGNNRVLLYDGIPTSSNSAQPALVLGQANLSANAAGCTAVTMSAPEDVWSNGTYVAVADSSNNRALVWLSYPTSNMQAADIVLGQPNATTCATGAQANQMAQTSSLAGDTTTLFVADSGNNRIVAYPWAQMQTNMSASYALGQQDLTSASANQGASISSQTLWYPLAVGFFNAALMVADTYNNRVLVYQSP